MAPSELQIEVERLRRELAKRDLRIAELEAMLLDRDATIARLSSDLAKLQTLVNRKRPTEREPRVRGCGGRALLTYAGAISAAGLRPNSRAQFSGSRSSTLLAEYPPTLTSTSAK